MKKSLIIFLLIIAFVGSSCIFFTEEKIETEQTRITSIHPTEKYIGIEVAEKDLKIHIKEDTKMTEGGKEIQFSDLDVGDKVEISYVSVKLLGLWDYGGRYAAKTVKVLE
jgi:hypothetical protein